MDCVKHIAVHVLVLVLVLTTRADIEFMRQPFLVVLSGFEHLATQDIGFVVTHMSSIQCRQVAAVKATRTLSTHIASEAGSWLIGTAGEEHAEYSDSIVHRRRY